MKITTDFVYPPIPIRTHDWRATDADRAEDDQPIVGWGRTEQEAIADFKEQLEEAS